MSEVKICKLITGELVIGSKSDEKLMQVFKIIPVNNTQVAVVPFFHPFSDSKVDIEYTYIITEGEPTTALVEQYKRNTSVIHTPTVGEVNSLKDSKLIIK